MKKNLLLIIISSVLILSACFFDTIKGSGNIITEERELAPFDEISLRVSGNVIITQGENQSVEISTDDNIMSIITTEVKNGKLVICSRGNIFRYSKLEIDIIIPEIQGLYVSGSGHIRGNEEILCNDIDIKVSGSGKVNLTLSAEDINTNISGSGKINLNGKAEELKVKISGSGDLNSEDLACEDASVRVSGSGDCRINATEDLDASISGSGNVYYKGNPDISTKVSGSGSVQKIR